MEQVSVLLPSIGRAVLFLGIPFILGIFFLQWKWARDCANNIRVLIAEEIGGGRFIMVPKSGGSLTLKNPHDNTTKMWAVNELATIEVLYPGIGFVPAFMQKTIRMAIVSEGDWEPLLNRSPHLRRVASPDMIVALEKLAEISEPQTKERILGLLEGISTAPTREMIASPAVLGNLIHEKVTEVAVTVAKDIMNPLTEAIKKLGQRINPMIVYIGLGLAVILLGFVIMKVLPLVEDVELIKQALGILQ